MQTSLKRWKLLPLIAFVMLGGHAGLADDQGRHDAVQRFATLPDGIRFPEGITANPATRQIYVGTFDFGPNPNKLLRFDHNGRLIAQRDFGATPLLGLAFHAATGKIYIGNFGAGKIQRISANFFAATPIEDVANLPHIGPPAPRSVGNPDGSTDSIIFGSNSVPAPNGLVFDSTGSRLYVSELVSGSNLSHQQSGHMRAVVPNDHGFSRSPVGNCRISTFWRQWPRA